MSQLDEFEPKRDEETKDGVDLCRTDISGFKRWGNVMADTPHLPAMIRKGFKGRIGHRARVAQPMPGGQALGDAANAKLANRGRYGS